MAKIRGIIAFVQFCITVALTVFAMYIFKNHIHKVIKIWMKLQVKALGIKLETQGKLDENCDMLIMNHQSLVDIIVIEHLHSKNLAWVAKKELEKVPFFGHVIKAPEMISIERENKTGIIHLLKEVKDRLSKARPIAMFPEGTRSKGNHMLKFKSGAKIIANKLELKVQPVVILNSRTILDSQNLKATPGTVKVIFLDPVIANKETSWFEDMEKNMNDVFNKESKNYAS